MGGHGDTKVPLTKFTTVAGDPKEDLFTNSEIVSIVDKTKSGGAQIVELLKTGSAYYAPAKSTAVMVEAILKDTKQIHSCAIYLEGEYGANNIVSGVPVMIGADGVERVITEMVLKHKQKEKFQRSVADVQEMVDTLYELKFFEEGDK
jgi:malate dehydrogenase